MALTEIAPKPEELIGLTAGSERILLLEITSVKESEPELRSGVKRWTLIVKGRVLEVVRGEEEREFEHSVQLMHVVDWEELEKSRDEPIHWMERAFLTKMHKCPSGILELRVGGRFLAIDFDFGGIQWFFVPAGQDDAWRAEVRELDAKLLKESKR